MLSLQLDAKILAEFPSDLSRIFSNEKLPKKGLTDGRTV